MEVAIWFSMPTILVSSYYEDELKVYFEITMRWNSSAGELSRSPGFCMLEKQVVAGIDAGYIEMLKMHEQNNSCPIVFLLLVDPSCAPNVDCYSRPRK